MVGIELSGSHSLPKKTIEPGTALWRSPLFDGVQFFRATFAGRVYGRHAHDYYAILVPECGLSAFTCRGASNLVAPGSFGLINPDEPHDGRSAEHRSFRAIYVEPSALTRLIDRDQDGSRAGRLPFFKYPSATDSRLAAEYLYLHRAIEAGSLGSLEAESRILAMLTRLVIRHGDFREIPPPARHTPLIRLIRDYLEENFYADPSLTDLSALSGLGRFNLLRQFSRETGLSPHDYLTQIRLREACRRLLAGESSALVAAEVGFVDQSHLIKRFRSTFGITPGQYVAAARSSSS